MFERRLQRRLRVGQARLARREFVLMGVERVLHRLEPRLALGDFALVWTDDGAVLALEASAPLLQRVERAQGAGPVGLFDAQLLLGLRKFAARARDGRIGRLAD